MKLINKLIMQLTDLLVYLLIPYASLLLPASVSRSLVRVVSGWGWVMADEAAFNCALAAEYTAIEDPREWQNRWRLVLILEARDLTLMMWGRKQAVFDEIENADEIQQTKDSVLVGMHWGPSIVILSLLESYDQNPLLVYRPVERSIFRLRPWYYLFLTRSVRYIRKTCGDRAITIRGAGARLREELPRPGSSVVVLDAPPAPGRSTIDGTVLGRAVKFNAGFPGILAESGRAYYFYAISLAAGDSGFRTLDLQGPAQAGTQDEFMRHYCAFLENHIRNDSAQWRIWQAASQFFVTTPPAQPLHNQAGNGIS